MMTPDIIAHTIFALASALFVYHHAAYPILLRYMADRRRESAAEVDGVLSRSAPLPDAKTIPFMRVIVPAHNEEAVIADKIRNLAALTYPTDRLSIHVVLDGCSDRTEDIARQVLDELDAPHITLTVYPQNVGKLAVLNAQIGQANEHEIIVLTDASAMNEPDALHLTAARFADPTVGVVCGTYRLQTAGSEGEAKYWDYQNKIKRDEAVLAAPMGAHGAFYSLRRRLWSPLPAGTINDDFVLPMRIVAAGHKAVYAEEIVATEIETTDQKQNFWRRVRIGAGNLQQIRHVLPLANPSRGWMSFVFLSGKALRPFIPFLVILGALAAVVLALRGDVLFQGLLAVGLAAAGVVGVSFINRDWQPPKPIAWLGYLIEGHAASFMGALRYLTTAEPLAWNAEQASQNLLLRDPPVVSVPVRACKRVLDLACAAGLFMGFVLFGPLIALAIRLESPGPIIYRQLRVGRATNTKTILFPLCKFRTMYEDAEARTGAVWATKNDPRITRVGSFLRKTRLDELPQFYNVMVGHMSAVGPRPERPSFCRKLEREIPYYVERTFGLRPGITGLAQVNQSYDESVNNVRGKVMYDHAYGLQLGSFMGWLKADLAILLKTVVVVFRRTG